MPHKKKDGRVNKRTSNKKYGTLCNCGTITPCKDNTKYCYDCGNRFDKTAL